MRDAEPTEDEQRFFEALSREIDGLDDWYHRDADGKLWMIVSYDFVLDGAIQKTLRCDYDGEQLAGGFSPSCLNWDDGVRAVEAFISTEPPDGLAAAVTDPGEAARLAARWFRAVIGRHDISSTDGRRDTPSVVAIASDEARGRVLCPRQMSALVANEVPVVVAARLTRSCQPATSRTWLGSLASCEAR